MRRQIIEIDEEKCNGCGQCMPACPEGALQLIDGKARLVRQSYCDGLGACLGGCPTGALRVVEAEVDAYDEHGVLAHLAATAPAMLDQHIAHLRAHAPELLQAVPGIAQPAAPAPVAACPSVQVRFMEPPMAPAQPAGNVASELRQWPVQLRLLPVAAPFFQDATLTLIADCVPFANPNMHAELMKDSAIAVGCPKLDDAAYYVDKLAEILAANDIRSLKVAYMEVPCCRGLVRIAELALARSGKEIPLETTLIRINA